MDVSAKNRKKILILVLSIVLPLVLIGVMVGIECWRRRRQNKGEEEKRNELGTHSGFPSVTTASNMMDDKFSNQLPTI